MPSAPCCAIAMASADSVTVSIAALTSGTLSRMLRVKRVETSTALGSTGECCGTSSTSSKVRAVVRPFSICSAAERPTVRLSAGVDMVLWRVECSKGRHTASAFE